MKYHVLGRTGQSVSALGFGTMNLPHQDLDISKRALNYALDRGINYIDTAPNYKNSEEIIGESISQRRQEFFLATKLRQRDYQAGKAEIEQSLRRLKTDYIDLLQIHYVNHDHEYDQIIGKDGALKAALEAQRAGYVRFLGISGHRPELLAKWIGSDIYDTVLFHMSLVQPFALQDLIPTCQQLNVGMIGMKPLSGAFVKPASMALRFSHSTPIDVLLSGMKTVDEVKENIAALETRIEPKEKEQLWSLAAELGEHGCRRCNYCSCPIGIRIPDIMISHLAREKMGLLGRGAQFYEEQAAKIQQCHEYEPCRKKPLCEPACPYDLPMQQTIQRQSKVGAK
ncbi:aldo/keto reductase [Ammoniphilus oxalaticus]|uniref:Aldo/keto reductase n=1 Tax=Ammoniphilus oxalaticus TaxID=66863 RepID=A0A419SKI4_9BACL|nr:aldo/keto reductase [Ammoniphilus oxalaticus]RKD24418.1 aldo/keto reductase [Ammoniphilus oxalaticus]